VPASPGPVVNPLDDNARETFPTGRPLEDGPDYMICKHCKRNVLKTSIKTHLIACLKQKKEKAQRKKEQKEAREREKKEAGKENDKDEEGDTKMEDDDDDDEASPEKKGPGGLKSAKKSAGKKVELEKGKKRKADADAEKGPKQKKKKEEPKMKAVKPKGMPSIYNLSPTVTTEPTSASPHPEGASDYSQPHLRGGDDLLSEGERNLLMLMEACTSISKSASSREGGASDLQPCPAPRTPSPHTPPVRGYFTTCRKRGYSSSSGTAITRRDFFTPNPHTSPPRGYFTLSHRRVYSAACGTPIKRRELFAPNPNLPTPSKSQRTCTKMIEGPVDVERQCGVMKDGVPCARSLTCKSHSMGAKRAVPGRSLPYDMLLTAYQKKNQAKQQSAIPSPSLLRLLTTEQKRQSTPMLPSKMKKQPMVRSIPTRSSLLSCTVYQTGIHNLSSHLLFMFPSRSNTCGKDSTINSTTLPMASQSISSKLWDMGHRNYHQDIQVTMV